MLSETCDPPKPRWIQVRPGNAFARSQYLMLELPTNSVESGFGGVTRSAASNASMSRAKRAGSRLPCAAAPWAVVASTTSDTTSVQDTHGRRFSERAPAVLIEVLCERIGASL